MAAGQEQDQDRTEQATPFKLKEARKRGQVSKSLEVNSLIMLFVALAVSYFVAESVIQSGLTLSQKLLADAHLVNLEGPAPVAFFAYIFESTTSIFWPFVLALVIAAIGANMFQTGPVFSFHPLKPDVSRINPVTGFKRLFSKKMLFESIKTVVKMAVYGFAVYLAIVALLPALMGLLDTPTEVYPALLVGMGQGLAAKLLLLILLIAMIDLVYTRWDYSQQMRMSHRDVKEETKRREGDPQVRSKRRQLQREAASRAGAVRKVPEADVLITNPTHIAIALKYDRDSMVVPQLIAKGAGDLAVKMKKVAYRSGVSVVENKPLARELFRKTGIDEGVPESLFPVVAKILAWVYMQRQQRMEALN